MSQDLRATSSAACDERLVNSTVMQDNLARRRVRRAAATSSVTLIARAVNYLASVILVPVTLGYLGPDRYGVWMTLLSVVAVIGISDLGIGNALVSRIAAADAIEGSLETNRYISTALCLFTIISAALSMVALVTFSQVPWYDVFNVKSNPLLVADAKMSAAVLLAIFLMRIPLDLVQNIRRGYQEGYVNAWFEIGSGISRILFVVLVVRLGLALPFLVGAAAVGPLLANIANWGHLLQRRPELRPKRHYVSRAYVAILLKGGSLFLALQLAMLVAYTADNFVAAQVLGPQAVTAYSVPSQLALAGIGVIGLLVAPLWPAYAEALARNDIFWVVRTFRRAFVLSVSLGAIGGLAFLAAGQQVIRFWSRGAVSPGLWLLSGLALWVVLACAGNAAAMLLNAAHIVRFQVVTAGSMAVVNVLLSVILSEHFGVAGLIWGTVLSYVLLVAIPLIYYVPRYLNRLAR